MADNIDSNRKICRNCKTKLAEMDGKIGYECLKCGLLTWPDGQVFYDPKEPKWKAVSAE